jgi:alpha-2-macroglobulin
VRKKFYDRNGRTITGNAFKQNELVVVEITLRTKESSAVENVAITDLLPACFEIENSRLNAERNADWMKDASIRDYTDIRDDRISFFTTATSKEKKFYYTVRVVGKGEFVMGPVGADAMYNGKYHSYSGSAYIIAK